VCTACFYLKDPAVKNTRAPRFILLDSSLFADSTLLMRSSVREAYRLTNYSLLWSDTAGFSKKADSLIAFIEKTNSLGLNPTHYHASEILEHLLKRDSDQRLMAVDVFLTDAYLTLSHDLKNGRVDPSTLAYIDLSSRVDSAGIDFLLKELPSGSLIGSLQNGINDVGRMMMRDSLAKILRAGIRDSINEETMNKLIVNIERSHLKSPPSERYIDVNIPGYYLRVIEGDSVFLESKVIVGKTTSPTPVLESVVTSFVIYPYWHVPRGIATREILPQIQKDSLYLSAHNYEILDIDGNVVDPETVSWQNLNANNFPYLLRQREGRENALGIIKFSFDNPYRVYLHDTNGPRLFSREFRALSHGCVRVQKARQLAKYLVKEDSVYITPDDLDQYLALQQRLKIKIPRPVQLYIRYATVEPVKGKLVFYKDIYGKDKELLARLSQSRLSRRKLSGLI